MIVSTTTLITLSSLLVTLHLILGILLSNLLLRHLIRPFKGEFIFDTAHPSLSRTTKLPKYLAIFIELNTDLNFTSLQNSIAKYNKPHMPKYNAVSLLQVSESTIFHIHWINRFSSIDLSIAVRVNGCPCHYQSLAMISLLNPFEMPNLAVTTHTTSHTVCRCNPLTPLHTRYRNTSSFSFNKSVPSQKSSMTLFGSKQVCSIPTWPIGIMLLRSLPNPYHHLWWILILFLLFWRITKKLHPRGHEVLSGLRLRYDIMMKENKNINDLIETVIIDTSLIPGNQFDLTNAKLVGQNFLPPGSNRFNTFRIQINDWVNIQVYDQPITDLIHISLIKPHCPLNDENIIHGQLQSDEPDSRLASFPLRVHTRHGAPTTYITPKDCQQNQIFVPAYVAKVALVNDNFIRLKITTHTGLGHTVIRIENRYSFVHIPITIIHCNPLNRRPTNRKSVHFSHTQSKTRPRPRTPSPGRRKYESASPTNVKESPASPKLISDDNHRRTIALLTDLSRKGIFSQKPTPMESECDPVSGLGHQPSRIPTPDIKIFTTAPQPVPQPVPAPQRPTTMTFSTEPNPTTQPRIFAHGLDYWRHNEDRQRTFTQITLPICPTHVIETVFNIVSDHIQQKCRENNIQY